MNVDSMYSEFSKDMVFALGPVPSAPSTPMKDDEMSGAKIIAVYWDKITTDVLEVNGYKLYADNGYDDDYKLVFDGTNKPEQTRFNFTKMILDTSLTFRFYVTGVNFNGEGKPSSVAYLKPCTSPSIMDRPQIMDLT